MGGFPAEGTLEFFFAGHKNCRIAGAAWTQFARDFAAGDALGGIDDLQDREAATVADVEGFTGNLADFLKRANMGIGDIEHVDVITDAGSVGRGVVSTKDIDVRQGAGGGIENARNEMSFHAMMFAALFGGAGGIEIAEGHVVEYGVGFVIRQNPFENELGFSVRIDRRFPMVFGNGNDFRLTVSGGSGRENEFFHAVASDGIEQIHAAGHVGGIENTGLANGFGYESFRGEVHHGVNFVLREDGFKFGAIGKIDLAKDSARRHGGTVALHQAIQGDDRHATRNQDFRADTADVTCRTGNENL